jgi:hypothetical protein
MAGPWIRCLKSGEGQREGQGAGAQGCGKTERPVDDGHWVAPANILFSVYRMLGAFHRSRHGVQIAMPKNCAISKSTRKIAYFATVGKSYCRKKI